MSSKRNQKFADKLFERFDRLDKASFQQYMLGVLKEKGFIESVFNTIKEAVIVVDESLEIRFYNLAAQSLLGLDEESTGKYIGKYLKQVDWHKLLLGDDRSWDVSRREMEIFYPEHRYLSYYIMPVSTSGGLKRGHRPLATLIFNDVTEVQVANEQNLETQKVKAITQLAAAVAHELGNPLNSLGIHLQLLKRSLKKIPVEPGSEQMEAAMKHIAVAEQEVQRLDSIVKNFLEAVRPKPPKREPLLLEKLLLDALEFMRNEIENKQVQVEARIPGGIPVLMGDEGQLTQAAYNLIKNAIQAMPEGGKLVIAVDVDDVHVNVRFIDNGPGIDEKNLSRLMEPYFTTKSSGTGLGLLIVDRIVRAHGGELTIESRPGEGTAFTISLPRHARRIRQLGSGDDSSREQAQEKQ
ncbi:MAG: PAS domain-containing protein [Lentisphaerae bacterium]|jgi:two-component system, sporulation sensor kinase E|nr:PAS domain-containing protein [Lentisphaerota bacterium]